MIHRRFPKGLPRFYWFVDVRFARCAPRALGAFPAIGDDSQINSGRTQGTFVGGIVGGGVLLGVKALTACGTFIGQMCNW